MTDAFMPSIAIGRARSSALVNCQVASWLGRHAVAMSTVEYAPTTGTKRNIPGALMGGLT